MKNTKKATRKPSRKPAAREYQTVQAKFIAALRDAVKRLLAGEEMHVYFSEGNSKTHMPSIDLLPLLTCHGRCRELCGKVPAGKYLPPCYAARIANRYPDTLRHYAENTALAIHRPAQYWQEVSDKMYACRFMRLFVSGDMIIPGYFSHLCDALQANPHCQVQGFTKCYETVNRYIDEHGALPENLHLLFSGWFDAKPVNPHNLPESAVYNDTLPDGWLSCGGDCSRCSCVGLGCWKASAGDVVGLKKH